ncbi:hypothetical protein [Nodosilinea sp. E11]|uniref:hypothetical protein n=1 Tax=Nodosilinea sp. E11 TaxID=3037479 RepID=UPI002934A0EB|nr:hypothetical protein [Nodosilinea sp. E11]WOD37019.1 hypothetical protein RRF56_00735 [Nodosilinea sp. E11]
MVNTINLTSLSLALVLGLGLQTAAQGQASPVSMPSAAAIAFTAGDRQYVSEMGGFSVAMPSDPEVVTRTIRVGGSPLAWTLATARTEAGTFAVAYTDIPLSLLGQGQSAVLEGLKAQPLLEDLDWQAIANQGASVYLDDIPGREYLYLSEGRFSDLQFYLVNRRLYVIMATASDLDAVYQFVNSFQIADRWRPFVSEAGNFGVDVPTTPVVTPQQLEYQGMVLIWRQFTIYNLMAVDDRYQIAYVDLPASVSTNDADALLSTVATTVLDSVNASALSGMGRPITLQGYPGREYLLTGNNGISYAVRFYRVADRLYGVVAGSRSVHNLDRFLSTFHFR